MKFMPRVNVFSYCCVPHRAAIVGALLSLTVACYPGESMAVSYVFRELDSGTVLAMMETDGTDPFDHTHLTSFSFTAAGDAIFGFGVGKYAGLLDESDGMFSFDASRFPATLVAIGGTDPGSASFVDSTSVPFSSFGVDRFTLIVSEHATGQTLLGVIDDDLFVGASGLWRVIPEPSAIGLAVSAVVIALTAGRSRSVGSADVLVRPAA